MVGVRPWLSTLRAPALPVLSGCLMLASLLSCPVDAQAGWFYRDNQIAYRMYQDGRERQALAYWDKSAQGWFGRGAALMRLGRMHEAEAAFRRSLALMPEIETSDTGAGPIGNPAFLASVWYNLGNCLYAQDELLQASQAWRTALNYEPEHAKARHNLAVVNRLLGKGGGPEDEPLGLTRHAKDDGHSGPQPAAAGQNAESSKQRPASRQHAQKTGQRSEPRAEGRPGRKQQERKGNHLSQTASANGPHGKGQAGQGGRPRAEGVSARQTENELRLVQEGVSVFLRHRLSEKEHGASVYRGPAW